MNKELIKQLESIGAKYFETANRGRVLANRKPVPLSNEGPYWGFYTEENVFQVWNGSSVKEGIKNPTFALILKAIKKHTGTDLTPKPTKRQEIEVLKVRMAKLEDALDAKNEAVDKNTARSVGNKGEIKALKSNKTVEIIEKTFGLVGACKALAKFQQAVDSKKFPEGGIMAAEVKGGERILSKSITKSMEAVSALAGQYQVDKLSEGVEKLVIKKLEEKKPFEIDDLVVLSKDLLKQPLTDEVVEAVNLQVVFKVLRIVNDVYYLGKQLHEGETWTMQECDLKHAPKEEAPKEEKKPFEVGDSVVIVCEEEEPGDFDGKLKEAIYEKRVLAIDSISSDDNSEGLLLFCVKIYGTEFLFREGDLEHAPVAPKEKALVFGDMMECIGVYDCLSKGQEVVFLAHSKEEKGKFDVIDEYANHYCAPSSYFKPL